MREAMGRQQAVQQVVQQLQWRSRSRAGQAAHVRLQRSAARQAAAYAGGATGRAPAELAQDELRQRRLLAFRLAKLGQALQQQARHISLWGMRAQQQQQRMASRQAGWGSGRSKTLMRAAAWGTRTGRCAGHLHQPPMGRPTALLRLPQLGHKPGPAHTHLQRPHIQQHAHKAVARDRAVLRAEGRQRRPGLSW